VLGHVPENVGPVAEGQRVLALDDAVDVEAVGGLGEASVDDVGRRAVAFEGARRGG